MATNNILVFCPTDSGTNLLTQVAYAAATDRSSGNQPGIASSKLNNKALRQANFIASQFAQYLCDKTGNDVLDDNNVATLLATIKSAFLYNRIQAIAGTDTILATSDIVECSGTGNYTITFPAGVAGLGFTIKKTGASGTITLGSTIDGVTVTLETQYQFINVYYNGTNWSQRG